MEPAWSGVLLSGGGSDGVDGLNAITSAGGLALAQDPDEAEHPTLPRNAAGCGHLAGVLQIDELADVLVALARGEAIRPKSTS